MSGNGDIKISGASIVYGNGATAVKAVDLQIENGEFFTLLGPSGCGKTTLLRSLAGFLNLSEGTLEIGGENVDGTPPHKRDTAMVFQSYALFPHLTVLQNVAYGLKPRGVSKAEAADRVREALAMVDLEGYEDRLPRNLSGGQQQRVVIARAIVTRPRVLLMDEPLANLDAKLRVRLRADVRALQQELGITTVYVTHDQEEALSLSDRIGVMSHGDLLQVGTPQEIYATPASLGVARFVGEGSFVRASLSGPEAVLENGQRLAHRAQETKAGERVWVGFRPHDARLVAAGGSAEGSAAGLRGTVAQATYLGGNTRVEVDAGLESALTVDVHPGERVPAVGEQVVVAVRPETVMVFPDDTDVASAEDVEL